MSRLSTYLKPPTVRPEVPKGKQRGSAGS